MSSHAGGERGVEHRFVESNGLRMHVAEAGAGPLVVLCHGFPESWYSWRHQLPALADAGYRAVAPDMRGYGLTDRPPAIDQYTLFHLVGDVLGVIDALGEETAVVGGHDWGAVVAWHAALLRPDRVRGVVGLSVPFRRRGPVRPTQAMPATPDAVFYQRYFQDPGVAEAELERDPTASVRALLVGLSGDAPGASPPPEMVRRGGAFLDAFDLARGALPRWLTEADVEIQAEQLARTGFRGGLAWYRNMDRNWELLAPYAGARVTVPALYVAGDRDLVVRFPGVEGAISSLQDTVPRLAGRLMLEGCGHWTQQERPGEVNAALRGFLSEV
jgi:pimeloyl-ACP methyl ester carboxylesterase